MESVRLRLGVEGGKAKGPRTDSTPNLACSFPHNGKVTVAACERARAGEISAYASTASRTRCSIRRASFS
jgi:hypothetical protein